MSENVVSENGTESRNGTPRAVPGSLPLSGLGRHHSSPADPMPDRRFSDGAVHAKPPLKSVSVPGPRKPKSLFGSGGFGARSPNKRPPTSHSISSNPPASAPAPDLKLTKGMNTLIFGDEEYKLSQRDIEDRGKIGNGVTGEVYRVLHLATKMELAAKKMVWMDETEERKRVLMDLNVMSVHQSPYIVKYYGSAIWNDEVWVFMELMATCLEKLSAKLGGPMPEDIVCKMAVSIVKALDYLKQQHKVIHRDVKPSNMLLDRGGNVKLCDFGISGRLVDSQAFTRGAGCAAFMAPERINLQTGTGGYDVRADIWSLGISLTQLATGTVPYSERKFKTEFELLTYIVQAAPPLPEEDSYSPQFYDFLSQCLTKDVSVRPHYGKLLEHPLIKEYESKPVDVGAWLTDLEQTVGF